MDGSDRNAAGVRDERSRRRRPWLPACLAAHGLTVQDVRRLSYVVVEEIVEDTVTLAISPWPAADGHGRLRFDVVDVQDVAVSLRQLHGELYRGWSSRRPRIGDVFAARVDPGAVEGSTGVWHGPLERLLQAPVYDMTAEARLVAKLALYAVRSDVLAPDQAADYGMTVKAVRNQRPAPVRASLARSRARSGGPQP